MYTNNIFGTWDSVCSDWLTILTKWKKGSWTWYIFINFILHLLGTWNGYLCCYRVVLSNLGLILCIFFSVLFIFCFSSSQIDMKSSGATQREDLIPFFKPGDFVCGAGVFSLFLYGSTVQKHARQANWQLQLAPRWDCEWRWLLSVLSGAATSNPATLSAVEAVIENRRMKDTSFFLSPSELHKTRQRRFLNAEVRTAHGLRKHQNPLCTAFGGVNRSVPDNSTLNGHEGWPSLSRLSLFRCVPNTWLINAVSKKALVSRRISKYLHEA